MYQVDPNQSAPLATATNPCTIPVVPKGIPTDGMSEAGKSYRVPASSVLSDGDYQIIRGRKYVKKSGARKLSAAFGISTQVVRENRIAMDGYFVYEMTVRAISPDGRFTDACSGCASNERAFSLVENDVRAIAQTRASNRAITDLVALWEDLPEEPREKARDDSGNKYRTRDRQRPETTVPDRSESITAKQRNLLIKLIEIRYRDERTRSSLFQKVAMLSKKEAGIAIKRMLASDGAK